MIEPWTRTLSSQSGGVVLAVSDAVGPLALAAVIALLGVGVLWWTRRKWGIRQSLKNAGSATAGSLRRSQVVELQGSARPHETTFVTPLTGEEAVAYEYEEERLVYRNNPDNDGGRNREWETVDSQVRADPFYVDDGTGQALVDAPTADLRLSDDYHVDTDDVDGGLVSGAIDSVTGAAGLDTGSDAASIRDEQVERLENSSNERRITERVIRPGDDVYVYGETVRPGSSNPGSGLFSGGSLLSIGKSLFSMAREGYQRGSRTRTGQGSGPGAPVEVIDHTEDTVDAGVADSGGEDGSPTGGSGDAPFEGPSAEQRRELENLSEEMQAIQNDDSLSKAEKQQRLMEASQGMDSMTDALTPQMGPGTGVDTGPDELMVGRGEKTPSFVVSDREKGGVLRSYTKEVALYGAVSLVLFAGSAYFAYTAVTAL